MSIWLFTWPFLHFTVISIIHDINSPFDCDPTQDARGIFLDVSMAFDEVWDKGLLFKLKTYSVKGEILNLLWSYFHERNQRDVLNGQISSSEFLGVLGPLLFLIYINDLLGKIQAPCKIFANKTSLFPHVNDKYKSRSVLDND